MLLNHIGAGFCWVDPPRPDPNPRTRIGPSRFHRRGASTPRPARHAAFHGARMEKKGGKRRSICTADELHRVAVSNSNWKLALWRYRPSPEALSRNHPLLLLSGVATNAIGYDLSPESSFARYMSAQGFDTWILEVRGAGLSTLGDSLEEDEECLKNFSKIDSVINDDIGESSASFVSEVPHMKTRGSEVVTKYEEMQLMTRFMEILTRISERLAGFLNGDLLEGQNSAIAGQIKDFNRRLRAIIEGQLLFPAKILELQDRFAANLEEFQKQLELMVKYDWDFDHYLEEDVPAAMEYIRAQCQPRDGKLLAIGHSMGGILLYAMLSSCFMSGFDGKDPGLASVVTLASSLDYTPSRSSLKLLLPLAEPTRVLNIPVIPVGPLMATVHPLASYPPYVLSWLNSQISAQDMMDQKLFEKLVLNNFGTVPSKLLLQLSSVFQKGGLRDRSGTFFYKDHLHKSNVPVLAIAGDRDLICPPEAVYETVKLIPDELVTYKVFGEPGGPHYAHYDLVGGRLAADQLYPCITEFLIHHDTV
ncbi:hypothetical protein GLYMA_09G180200v4 [Glycine max]|uniref:AB hydrolase-1 domain-containing protein n=2 Tax=Glycine max TaxID=3847 RepID=A0A0R0I9Y7_SOYBN|nr:uncharacterized protein LOC100798430 isoform X2 [Glycine max]KRH39134.1 hypothetical protein GLYMA_09G180200v4 [Glycine max]|eukprot:XP_006587488.1 uncharacterized protein LOC100798430 isoform X2 [Glycine max]